MYLCKFCRETPTGSEDGAQKRLILQFFKDKDLEIEMTLKIKLGQGHQIILTLHVATMIQYIKFS